MNIRLTKDEIKKLSEIEQLSAIHDAVMCDEPYAFFLRQNLISHEISSLFPIPPSVDGFVSIPRNALVITDLGRQVLRESEQQRQEMAENHSAERRKEKSSLRNAIISAVSGSLLTLIVEHFDEIIRCLVGLF